MPSLSFSQLLLTVSSAVVIIPACQISPATCDENFFDLPAKMADCWQSWPIASANRNQGSRCTQFYSTVDSSDVRNLFGDASPKLTVDGYHWLIFNLNETLFVKRLLLLGASKSAESISGLEVWASPEAIRSNSPGSSNSVEAFKRVLRLNFNDTATLSRSGNFEKCEEKEAGGGDAVGGFECSMTVRSLVLRHSRSLSMRVTGVRIVTEKRPIVWLDYSCYTASMPLRSRVGHCPTGSKRMAYRERSVLCCLEFPIICYNLVRKNPNATQFFNLFDHREGNCHSTDLNETIKFRRNLTTMAWQSSTEESETCFGKAEAAKPRYLIRTTSAERDSYEGYHWFMANLKGSIFVRGVRFRGTDDLSSMSNIEVFLLKYPNERPGKTPLGNKACNMHYTTYIHYFHEFLFALSPKYITNNGIDYIKNVVRCGVTDSAESDNQWATVHCPVTETRSLVIRKRSDSPLSIGDMELMIRRHMVTWKDDSCFWKPWEIRNGQHQDCPANFKPRPNIHQILCCGVSCDLAGSGRAAMRDFDREFKYESSRCLSYNRPDQPLPLEWTRLTETWNSQSCDADFSRLGIGFPTASLDETDEFQWFAAVLKFSKLIDSVRVRTISETNVTTEILVSSQAVDFGSPRCGNKNFDKIIHSLTGTPAEFFKCGEFHNSANYRWSIVKCGQWLNARTVVMRRQAVRMTGRGMLNDIVLRADGVSASLNAKGCISVKWQLPGLILKCDSGWTKRPAEKEAECCPAGAEYLAEIDMRAGVETDFAAKWKMEFGNQLLPTDEKFTVRVE